MTQEADITIVNAQLRLTLLAIFQVLGDRASNEVLEKANLGYRDDRLPEDNAYPGINAAEYAKLFAVVEKTYNRSGSRILNRIGKAYFHLILRDQSSLAGIAKAVLSLWPEDLRIRFILESLIDMMRKSNPQSDLRIDRVQGVYSIVDHSCTICLGRTSDSPACNFTVGIIEEAIDWVSEKQYEISETECIAKGDNFCRFSIKRLS